MMIDRKPISIMAVDFAVTAASTIGSFLWDMGRELVRPDRRPAEAAKAEVRDKRS